MPFTNFPSAIDEVDLLSWETFEPYFADLQQRDISGDQLVPWLQDWSKLDAFLSEAKAVLHIERTLDTADEQKESDFLQFVNHVWPSVVMAQQRLKERFLDAGSSQEPFEGLEIILRNMSNQSDLFRAENVKLHARLEELASEYDKINASMIADWDGEEKNLSQLSAFMKAKDRATRERAWRTQMALWQERRQDLDRLYGQMLGLRQQVAQNTGLPSYRDYVFREYDRFAYSPDDCLAFHEAIETAVLPATRRIYERKKNALGLDVLRPWDVEVDVSSDPPLRPYQGQEELVQGCLNIFHALDPQLSHYLAVMAEENLLDLDTRPGKAMGGYCSALSYRQRPFIFMNGVGIHDDVQTMLHEAGHAFHVFETCSLPLFWQTFMPMEFAEVASMGMELLSAPYLTTEYGGFYTSREAARARIEHLESILLFLPYMAVVDAFQHWVYTHVEEAAEAANCDAAWGDLWARFMPDIDFTGLEAERVSGWHRKLHIFQAPFYYIEYGMAQVGALQLWRNARLNEQEAVSAYRAALRLGGAAILPELFETAGAEFRFDSEMLGELVQLTESTIEQLQASA